MYYYCWKSVFHACKLQTVLPFWTCKQEVLQAGCKVCAHDMILCITPRRAFAAGYQKTVGHPDSSSPLPDQCCLGFLMQRITTKKLLFISLLCRRWSLLLGQQYYGTVWPRALSESSRDAKDSCFNTWYSCTSHISRNFSQRRLDIVRVSWSVSPLDFILSNFIHSCL